MSIKVLLAGETWISQSTHFKGFDSFSSVTYHSGADAYIAALATFDISVTHMPAHDVPQDFPKTVDECQKFDVIVLSDIGANSLQLPPETWLHGQASPSRLDALNEWVHAGGGLMMAGGYLSFQGFQARANFARSPLATSLPVTMSDFDDRVECSAGEKARAVDTTHELAALVTSEAPNLLGYNRVFAKDEAEVVATVGRRCADSDRELRIRPHASVDFRHRTTLVPPRIPRLEWFRTTYGGYDHASRQRC